MSYFVQGYDITIYKGDSVVLPISFDNLPADATGDIYMQINTKAPIIKSKPVVVSSDGKASATFDFTQAETLGIEVGSYIWGVKFVNGDNEDTITPSPEIEMTFTVKEEVVAGG